MSWNTSWGLYGNTDTSISNFLGTTDARPLLIKTSDKVALRVSAGGDVSIGIPAGTRSPDYKLDVGGDLNADEIYKDGTPLIGSQWQEVIGGIAYNGGNVGIRNDVSENVWKNQLLLQTDKPLSEARLGFATTAADGSGHHTAIIKTVAPSDGGGDLLFQIRETGFGALTERLRIRNDGRVGIGTSSPASKLHVHGGRLRIGESDGSQTSGVLELSNGPKTNYIVTDGTTGHLSLRTDSATHHVVLQAGGTQGNVGIGTASPGAKLQVSGGAIMPAVGNSTTAGIRFPADPGGGSGDEAYIRYFAESGETTKLLIGCQNDADDRIGFHQYGAERLTIYNGLVGIGTTNPQHGRLMIEDASVPISMRESGQAPNAGGLWRVPLDAGIVRFDANTAAAGDFSSYATPLAMTAAGNVGIGGTPPANYRLLVQITGGGTDEVRGVQAQASGTGTGQKLGVYGSATGAGPKLGGSFDADSAGTEPTYGIVGRAYGAGTGMKTGVRGWATGGGEKRAGNFEASSGAGTDATYGNFITASTAGGGPAHGVYSTATGDGTGYKVGVRAIANGGGWKYGGLFDASSATTEAAYGVYSQASGDGTGEKYGFFSSVSGGGQKFGIYCSAGGEGTSYAGYFAGNVKVIGNFTVSNGTKSFVIDHPLDPENKTLRHNVVESPENLCLYRGKVKIGRSGREMVRMPDYFAALTKEEEATVFLTPIGKEPSSASYQWDQTNTKLTVFGTPDSEVAYLVLADRDDPAVHLFSRPVEEEKGEGNFEKGKLLSPEAFDQPAEMGVASLPPREDSGQPEVAAPGPIPAEQTPPQPTRDEPPQPEPVQPTRPEPAVPEAPAGVIAEVSDQ